MVYSPNSSPALSEYRKITMELKDFIENAVSDIIDATQGLKNKYNDKNAMEYDQPIAPNKDHSFKNNQHTIDFDIAVTTSENGNAKAGSKIGISVLGANIGGEKGYTNENSSRIKFSVPFYPEHIKKD